MNFEHFAATPNRMVVVRKGFPKMRHSLVKPLQYLVAVACSLTFVLSTTLAQQSAAQQAGGQAEEASSDVGYHLAFHLPAWKTLHFNEPEKATEHIEAVKKLGCAVQKRDHAGHIDVVFRCNEWKVMLLDDADKAAGWQTWLKGFGFDTSLTKVDPVFAVGAETVDFRLGKWKRIHGNGSAAETEMVSNLKKMGVEVVVEDHGNHNDISFRSPTWRTIHVANHSQAEQWMSWLKQVGFETRHEH